MRNIPILLMILLLLTACSENEAIVPIKNLTDEEEPETLSEVEAKKFEEEFDQYLEFIVDDEIVSISIEEIPILQQYLLVQNDPQQKIVEMEMNKFGEGPSSFFILRFSCYNEHCSYLILHPDSKKSAFLVADIAKFESYIYSPDKTKVAFLFNRYGENNIPYSHIIVFDLNDWTPLSLENMDEEQDMLGFKWPILYFDWMDESSLTVSFPELFEPTDEYWQGRSSMEENSVQTYTFQLTDK